MSLTTSIAYWTKGGSNLPNAFDWQARAKYGSSIVEDAQSRFAVGQALSLRTMTQSRAIGGFGANGGTMAPLSNRRHGGAYSRAMPKAEWSEAEVSTLKSLYGLVSNRELAGRLGRSIKSIRNKAMREGLNV